MNSIRKLMERKTSLHGNILANYVGQAVVALLGLLFVPFYVKNLGLEAYGLVGVFLTLQVWLGLADMGMTPLINRETARFTAGASTYAYLQDLLHSISIIYLGLIFLIIVVIWFLSPWLALHWFNTGELEGSAVENALFLMGIAAAFKWFGGIYRGAIAGLQQLVWLNAAGVAFAFLRFGGAALVIGIVSPTITAFFFWNAMVSIFECFVFWGKVKFQFRGNEYRGAFSMGAIKGSFNFSANMSLTAVLVLLLTQVDKVFLSKMLTLENFGSYTLATTMAGSLSMLVSPVAAAIYPRFAQLCASQKQQELVQVYHQSAQIITVLLTPAALMLFFFASPILRLWTGLNELPPNIAPVLGLLALGNLLNGYMHVPYMLQLAAGWPSLGAKSNCVAVFFFIPLLLWIVPSYGAIGAALLWGGLNLGYVGFTIQVMHKKLLKNEKYKWYMGDIILPAFLCAIPISILSAINFSWLSRFELFLYLIFVFLIGITVSLLGVPTLFYFVKSTFFGPARGPRS